MKKILIVFSLIIICFSFSCKRQTKQSTTDISLTGHTEIKLTPAINDQLLLSDITKSIRFIEFDSSENALIGEIKILNYDNNMYFCQDEKGLIYCYDTDGKFIRKIGQKGHGRGELIYPGEFTLNKEDEEVWLIDNYKEIKRYTYNGDFKESIDLKKTVVMSAFNIFNNKLFCYTAKSTIWKNDGTNDYWCNELTIIENDETISRYFPVNKELYTIENRITMPESTPFSDLGSSLTFHHNVSNVIYSIDKESANVSVKYIVDFGDVAFKEDLSQMTVAEMGKYISENPKQAGFIFNVIETDSFLHFRYEFGQRSNSAIYDKKSKHIKDGGYVNDVFTSRVRLLGQRDNKLIGCIDNISLLDFTDKASRYLSKEDIERLGKLDAHSNVVLVEIELNNF